MLTPLGHSKGVAPGSTVEIGYSPYSDMSSRKNSLSQTFEYVTYQEVDAEQRIQFEALLKRVCTLCTCIQPSSPYPLLNLSTNEQKGDVDRMIDSHDWVHVAFYQVVTLLCRRVAGGVRLCTKVLW